jgi:hypothetical protein
MGSHEGNRAKKTDGACHALFVNPSKELCARIQLGDNRLGQISFTYAYQCESAPLPIDVSVIILNYNGSRFLRNLFESLSNQTFTDFEVVFVDNNSTDDSLRLMNKILANEPTGRLHVKIIKNAANLGYCKGNNVGLKYGNGKYVVFLNNDTYVSTTWLEELVKVMDADPSIGACQSRLIRVRTGDVQMDGNLLDIYGWPQGLVFCRDDLAVSEATFYVSGASMIVRRHALLRIGGFDTWLFFGDFDLCWRLRLLGYKMAVALRSICYHYGSVATNMLVSPVKSVYNQDREILRVFLKNYSTGNLIKRTPLSVILMIVEAAYLSFKYKNPLCLANFLKALVWNLRKLKYTLFARYQIQNGRNVSDSEIEKKMLRYPVLLTRRWTVEIT